MKVGKRSSRIIRGPDNGVTRALRAGSGTPAIRALNRIAKDVIACERCPRLRAYCEEVARVKRKAYAREKYWARPIPGFGDPGAWLLLVGLAPGAHGANRTGRMFTGDRSGEWLYGESTSRGSPARRAPRTEAMA